MSLENNVAGQMRTHVDLFTGLAGFTLAAHACGVRTIAFCESDARCQAFLGKAWPGIPCWPDVRSFSLADALCGEYGEHTTESERRAEIQRPNAPWLLTAGVPCQPASRAGKQRGASDDRWLWPAALAVLGDLQPTWAILENPPGIGDMDFAGILSQVASHGYQTRVFSIPACAVGAPHRRERYWIVANRTGQGYEGGESGSALCGGLPPEHGAGDVADATQRGQRTDGSTQGGTRHTDECDEECMAHPKRGIGGEIRDTGRQEGPRCCHELPRNGNGLRDNWDASIWLPCADGKFRRAPDDTVGLVDGLHRSLLAALGNSIVPQVAQRIIQAMILSEKE